MLARRQIAHPSHNLKVAYSQSNFVFVRRSSNAYPHTPSTASGVLSKVHGLINADRQLKPTDAEAEAHNRRLSSFRAALGTRDLFAIRDAYGVLREHQSEAAIFGRDLQEMSGLLESHFSTCSGPSNAVVRSVEMAILAAARGHTSALRAYLLLHLKAGDTRSVVSTYDRFQTLSSGKLVDDFKQTAVGRLVEGSDYVSDDLKDNSAHPDIADLALIVITAHVMEDSFDDALNFFLKIPMTTRLTLAKVQDFFRTHLPASFPLEKIREWTKELVFLRLISKEYSLHNYLLDLSNKKSISSLQSLYTSFISHLNDGDGRLVMESTSFHGKREPTRRTITISTDVWASFLEAFFRCHRSDLAEKLWEDIVKMGLTPDHRMWSILVDGYGRQRSCDMAENTWNRMLEAGVEPDEICYGAMISAYFSASKPDLAFAMFQQFRTMRMRSASGKESLSSPRARRVFNIVLHGLCINAKDDLARNVLKDMTQQGPKPDVVSFNTFLRHYERIGDMKNLGGILRSLGPAGVEPDVHSFTTVLSALYKAGKPDAHVKTLEIMKAMNVQPNVATYSAIIHFFVRLGGAENLHKAGELLARMEKESNKECRPNEVTYTGILAAVHRDASISPQDAKVYTAELLGRMRNQGKLPNRTTYHILIKACLENPQPLGLELALQYYREMNKRNIKLFDDTWYVLLSGLFRRGDLAIAEEIIQDMFRSGHKPNSALMRLISKIQKGVVITQ